MPRSLRKRGGRKPGGQDGHKGARLAQVARPDREARRWEPKRLIAIARRMVRRTAVGCAWWLAERWPWACEVAAATACLQAITPAAASGQLIKD